MKYLIPFLLIIFLPAYTMAQQGNMLLLKKKGKVLKTYYEGSELLYNQGLGMQRARIEELKNDSISLIQYNVRTSMTSLGVYILDTVSTYRSMIPYKNILEIGKEQQGWDWNASGATLFGGGTLLATAGLVTWIFSNKNSQYYAKPALVISGAVAAGVGFLLMKSTGHKFKIGKKYSLGFISTQ